MPLRDHFRPQLDDWTSWDGFHGQWPSMIVQAIADRLPTRYVAAPHVHLGSAIEVDVATDFRDQDEFEVRVFDTKRGRRLVAAIEIVSPANKDRPEHRRAFVAKCVGLLQNRVSVVIVDLVTTRSTNLYGDLLDVIGLTDPALANGRPSLSAVACRWVSRGDAWHLESWTHTLALGRELPILPLWLADEVAVPLELEPSYEETCRVGFDA